MFFFHCASTNSASLVHFCYFPLCWINFKIALAAGNASVVEYNKHNQDNKPRYDHKWESTDAVSSSFILRLFTRLYSLLPAPIDVLHI